MAAAEDCIFCQIVKGSIPCWKLHETEQVLAFLDIGPLSRGHCLVIPKVHYRTIDRMPAELAAACLAVVPALSRALIEACGAESWNVLQNNGAVSGQVVEHVHLHIIPRRANDGLGFHWPAGSLDPGEAAALQEKITSALA
ncbi:MAG: HIT family protein [Phycisphaerae bacterium]|nr:HIT family protein [Phycisphaerae bacterium]